jgi:cyanuric acid amidohydrolase
MECILERVPMRHPGDVSGIEDLIETGRLTAAEIVAILGKTEGNGCVNDFTRAYAVSALSAALAPRLGVAAADVPARVAMVISGGTEGGLSPHFLVFAVSERGRPAPGVKRLALGTARTRLFKPEEIGRVAQAEATAAAVSEAIASAAIDDDRDVHWVQIKCPLLTNERIGEATARGVRTATTDTYASMGLSRGASALGVALALGEIESAALDDQAVGENLTLWSGRASSSAGIELMHNEVIVLGNSARWAGDMVIAHDVMADAIDLPALGRVLHVVGLPAAGQLDAAAASRVVAVLAKAEAGRSGVIRGARHIMNDDSDIHSSRHARALVGGVIAGMVGRTNLFVSGGAEHQGPDGGGPIAIIARVAER